MGIKIGKIHICSDSDSPEMILAFLVPLVILAILLENNYYSYQDSILISLSSGFIVFIFITLLKNIIAMILKSDVSCRIPKLNDFNTNQ